MHSGKPAVVEGSYRLSMTTPMGPQDGDLDLAVSGGNLSGKVTTMIGAVEFDTGTVDGPQAHWHAEADTPMGLIKMEGNATVDGDDIWGAISLGAGMPQLTFEGIRNS